ncbi:MAG: hypothetical protein ACOC4I_02330 [Spirochaetota bacterium]
MLKPALTALALCNRLGDRQLGIGALEENPAIRWVAASDSESGAISLLVCHWSNVRTREKSGARINILLEGLGEGDYRSVRYRIAPSTASAFELWNDAGAPVKPDMELLRSMQDESLKLRAGKPRDEQVQDGVMELTARTDPGSVELILIASRDGCPAPAPPERLRLESYRGDGGAERAVLSWKPVQLPSLLTYHVWADDRSGGKPQDITGGDATVAALRIPNAYMKTGMMFRVTVEDFWGRESESSDPIIL